MSEPASPEHGQSLQRELKTPPEPALRAPLSETLRFLYLVFLPIAGCSAVIAGGGRIGHGWGFGIAIGLFLYHYLNWALYETDRVGNFGPSEKSLWQRWCWVLPPLLVLATLGGDPVGWLIEQTLLEAGAFVAAMGLLAMMKCKEEGKEAPWFLAIVVFVLPSIALLFKLGAIWLGRRGGSVGGGEVAFAGAWLFSLVAQYRRLRPYVTGRDQLVEPLSTPGRLALTVVWLLGLLIGGIVIGG
ncbi:MAG: hypothetical protein JNJ70_17290 [Verrucomicrobiales bacterium]|nr:hypothetical protein [Verrucomicrobiales bacterium]